MLIATTFCLLAFVAWTNGECVDTLASCSRLQEQYCSAPYDVLAVQVCPKRCGLCDESNNSINKRSHNHGPEWADHCWDNNSNHVTDPFCALLTTTTTPKPTTPTTTTTTVATTTTTEPTTTTTEPTTTTPEPTTTTTEPTTTTTMTTTTTEPTTTTTTLPPTTTERACHYEEYNETDIKSTDFGTDIALVQNTNITLNESVHLIGDVSFCEGVCAQSLLNDGFECWAFTYNDVDRCYLYYYNRPLSFISQEVLNNGTSLFLKRCTDDPLTTARPAATTAKPATQAPAATTQAPAATTQAPAGTTQAPAGTTQGPAAGSTDSGATQSPAGSTDGAMGTTAGSIVINTTEILNFTKIIFGTTIVNIINGTVQNTNPPPLMTTDMGSGSGGSATDNTGAPPMLTTTSSGGSGTTAGSGTGTGGGGQVGPDTSAGPGGVVIVSSNSYKVSGTRSPVPDTCFFLNQTFSKGEHWKDSCRYDCECFDTDTNTALCVDICPHFSSIPPTCTIKTEPGQCCPQLDCGNNTEIINSTSVDQGSGNVSDCRDMQDNCDYYEDNACSGVYEPWARAHCALRCGYCDYAPPCYDRLTYCSLYELETACVDYRGWARYNCKRSCGICT